MKSDGKRKYEKHFLVSFDFILSQWKFSFLFPLFFSLNETDITQLLADSLAILHIYHGTETQEVTEYFRDLFYVVNYDGLPIFLWWILANATISCNLRFLSRPNLIVLRKHSGLEHLYTENFHFQCPEALVSSLCSFQFCDSCFIIHAKISCARGKSSAVEDTSLFLSKLQYSKQVIGQICYFWIWWVNRVITLLGIELLYSCLP